MVVTKTDKCEGNLLCGVNTAQDPQHMSDIEKQHTPVITAPQSVGLAGRDPRGMPFEVTIEVGKLMPHQNEATHAIEFIELYADHTHLARMDFTPMTTEPVMKARVSLDHAHASLRAYGRCNMRGVWMSQAPIRVMG